MRVPFLFVIIFILPLAILAAIPSEGPTRPFRIMLDPGHGGTDLGAVYSGIRESQLVLQVAQKLAQKMKADSRFEVAMTRTTDTQISLQDRVRKSDIFKSDLLVSIHANATTDQRAKGMEIFVEAPWNSQEEEKTPNDFLEMRPDLEIHRIVQDLKNQGRRRWSYQFTDLLREDWKGHVKPGSFYVLHRPKSPSVLLEIGFLSHPQESKWLLSNSTQEQITQNLHKALIKMSQVSNKDFD